MMIMRQRSQWEKITRLNSIVTDLRQSKKFKRLRKGHYCECSPIEALELEL